MTLKSSKRHRTIYKHKNENGDLLCLKCLVYKQPLDFDINSQDSNCFYRDCKDRCCKECKKQQALKRRLSSRGKKDLDRLLLERWHGIKDRVKKQNLILDFDWIYLKELWNRQNGLCNLSNLPMTYIMNSGRIATNVSVDRIDSNQGYTKTNVQLVCMAVNQMKSDLTLEELIYFCNHIINTNENKNKTNTKKC